MVPIAPKICTFTSTRGASLSTQHRVQILREANGLTVGELAELAGIHPNTLRAIEKGTSRFKTQWSVAERLAGALYVKVSDLFLVDIELSPLGRPAGTGGDSVTITQETIVYERITFTRQTLTMRGEAYCHNCFLVVPSTPHCTQCGKAL